MMFLAVYLINLIILLEPVYMTPEKLYVPVQAVIAGQKLSRLLTNRGVLFT
jgi:hypothetical protein